MENIQQDILTTTLELFNDKGLDFTMDDIAQSMHIAKKTIYRFFSPMDAMARQPEKIGELRSAMIIAAALVEGVAFFAAIIALLCVF